MSKVDLLKDFMSEPRDVHQPWCNIWTTPSKPCNCGAGHHAVN